MGRNFFPATLLSSHLASRIPWDLQRAGWMILWGRQAFGWVLSAGQAAPGSRHTGCVVSLSWPALATVDLQHFLHLFYFCYILSRTIPPPGMEHFNWVIILSDMAESGVLPLRKIPIIYRFILFVHLHTGPSDRFG